MANLTVCSCDQDNLFAHEFYSSCVVGMINAWSGVTAPAFIVPVNVFLLNRSTSPIQGYSPILRIAAISNSLPAERAI
jgi:hypothetical protein